MPTDVPAPRRLLIVAHGPSENTRRLREAVLRGARSPDIANVQTTLRPPLEAGPEDVLGAGAIILGTTENLGYMSGALKDFFERIYHPCLEQTAGLPYALVVKGDTDVDGAVASVERIVSGLRWRAIAPPVVVVGALTDDARAAAAELGATVAASLDAGII